MLQVTPLKSGHNFECYYFNVYVNKKCILMPILFVICWFST